MLPAFPSVSATASSLHTALESNWGDGYMYSPLAPSAVTTAKPSPYGDERDDHMLITPATEDHMDEDDDEVIQEDEGEQARTAFGGECD